jgi:hypothetical protein
MDGKFWFFGTNISLAIPLEKWFSIKINDRMQISDNMFLSVLDFLNIMHATKIIKKNYSVVSRISLDKSRID